MSILPLAAGAAAYGFAFGVLAAQAGFPWWGVALMSAGVHAGSSQIVAVERFLDDGALVGAVIAGLALNLRYLGLIASLEPVLRETPLWARLGAVHIVGDENWALTLAKRSQDPSVGFAFLVGSGMTMIGVWTLSTTLGAVAGETAPDLASYGLGFAFTAAFIAMARALWRGRHSLGPWALSAGSALGLIALSTPTGVAILAAGVIGVAPTLLRTPAPAPEETP